MFASQRSVTRWLPVVLYRPRRAAGGVVSRGAVVSSQPARANANSGEHEGEDLSTRGLPPSGLGTVVIPEERQQQVPGRVWRRAFVAATARTLRQSRPERARRAKKPPPGAIRRRFKGVVRTRVRTVRQYLQREDAGLCAITATTGHPQCGPTLRWTSVANRPPSECSWSPAWSMALTGVLAPPHEAVLPSPFRRISFTPNRSRKLMRCRWTGLVPSTSPRRTG